jgi:glycosyltransferase involved in cell wall biosynthesis
MSNLNKNTFFTIVVPTRERCDTLIHTLNTILSQDYENFSVLVSDNASNDDTHKMVMELKNSRLKYINTGHRVSMAENWEFSLNHVESGWVTVLGDDDGILPGSLKYVDQIIKLTGIQAIRSNGCSYSWPSLLESPFGNLSVSKKRGFVIRSSEKMLQQVMDGKANYSELPVLYNGGFVSVDIIKRAKEKTGAIFRSMTPDVYSGIVTSFLTEEYVYCYEPLAINGASAHSGGTAGFEKVKRRRAYDPAEKFWNESNIPFHPDLPLMSGGRSVRSIAVLVYEAFLQAAPFHSLKAIKTSKLKQLKIMLLQSGPDHGEIVDWAKLFAKKNNINLSTPYFSQSTLLVNRLKLFPKMVANIFTYFGVAGSDRLPLHNIYEASIVAGLIKELNPNIFQAIRFQIKKLRKFCTKNI